MAGMNDFLYQNEQKRRPDLIRPVPRRVVKPTPVYKMTTIHPRMVQDFTQEASHLTPGEVDRAVQESQEWHRKWTLQQEEAHVTMYDRDEGAKNPSLSSSSSSSPMEPAVSVLPSPALRPCRPGPYRVPSPLALPVMAPCASPVPFALDDDALFSAGNLRQSRASTARPTPDSPRPCFSAQSSVHSGLSGLTSRDDESVMGEAHLESLKESLYHALAIAGGDVTDADFIKTIEPLAHHYESLGWDACKGEGQLEGMWLTLSKATFFGNLGENPHGDPMYTLGRMAFDMFCPTQLVCSLQGNFNPVHVVPPEERPQTLKEIPKSLLEEVEMGNNVLRTYNIVTAFTIESHLADYPDAPNKTVRRPIKGIMTTFGYVLPDPQVPNRLSIWFTGGTISPNNDEYDVGEWKRLFSGINQHEGRSFGAKTRVLMASLLMGAQVPTQMQEDGTLEYEFTRPLGGHGVAYVDVLYLDGSLRIARGHRGTIFVFTRIPDNHDFK